MSNVRTVDFVKTGLSSVFRLSIHHGVLVMYIIVLVGLGRLASRTISVYAEWITTPVWSRMCLPVIGNSSLVNLNELNYHGGYFPGIQRPCFHMYHNRLSVHEPSMSIYQAYDLLY